MKTKVAHIDNTYLEKEKQMLVDAYRKGFTDNNFFLRMNQKITLTINTIQNDSFKIS